MLFQQIQQGHRHPLNSSSGHLVNLWMHLAPLGITWKTFGRHPGHLNDDTKILTETDTETFFYDTKFSETETETLKNLAKVETET